MSVQGEPAAAALPCPSRGCLEWAHTLLVQFSLAQGVLETGWNVSGWRLCASPANIWSKLWDCGGPGVAWVGTRAQPSLTPLGLQALGARRGLCCERWGQKPWKV